MSKKVAICVGHSRLVAGNHEGGAISTGGVSEWKYNVNLSAMIVDELDKWGIQSVEFKTYEGRTYGTAVSWLAERIKAAKCGAAVELHFNSAAGAGATGHEWLHWFLSERGKSLARSIHQEYSKRVPELKSRGLKAIGAMDDRGAGFLRQTHCPAVIAEPFFGSNAQDWAIAQAKKPEIAKAIAAGIARFSKG